MRCFAVVLALVLACPAPAVAAQSAARSVVAVRSATGKLEQKAVLQGEVLPLAMAHLIPRVTGTVASIPVREGDVVDRGTELVRLSCPDLEAEVEVAAAMHDAAVARVGVARSAVGAARRAVAVAEADVAARRSEHTAARVAREQAQVDHHRAQALHDRNAVTLAELEQAELARDRAAAALDAAASTVTAAEARLELARAAVAAAEAELASDRARAVVAAARADKARVMLDFATLESPYPRTLVSRQRRDVGAMVRADETVVLEVMNAQTVRIRFGVPEVEAGYVSAGTAVRILEPRTADDDVRATVTRTARSIAPDSRAMAAEVELDNRDGRWTPGSLCRVEVTLLARDDAVTIPTKAIEKDGPDTFVWVARDGSAERVQVRLGLELTETLPGGKPTRRVQVLEGLRGGELVVVAGAAGLREGVPLQVSEQEQ